jgi:hypothetical protein
MPGSPAETDNAVKKLPVQPASEYPGVTINQPVGNSGKSPFPEKRNEGKFNFISLLKGSTIPETERLVHHALFSCGKRY